ncbi:MAG: hypothetical protein HGA67_03255 [Candidatus Yonathbacteria bacterium]|nr:hypothetical protein [Candidatus Yonathbacteria bacterium]
MEQSFSHETTVPYTHPASVDVNPPLQAAASSIPVLPSVSADRERFMRVAFPMFAGIPTAMVILFFFDFGETYRNVIDHVLSPIITGVTSGFILYILGLKR